MIGVADILKAILDREGAIVISERDANQAQDKKIGMIESWDDKGNKTYTIYTHQARSK